MNFNTQFCTKYIRRVLQLSFNTRFAPSKLKHCIVQPSPKRTLSEAGTGRTKAGLIWPGPKYFTMFLLLGMPDPFKFLGNTFDYKISLYISASFPSGETSQALDTTSVPLRSWKSTQHWWRFTHRKHVFKVNKQVTWLQSAIIGWNINSNPRQMIWRTLL